MLFVSATRFGGLPVRLIIIAIVCSLLTVGGFFGFKQYQRAEMKQGAHDYVMSMIQRAAKSHGPEAESRIVEFCNEAFDETFRDHYISGGLSKPAEFSDVAFSRDLFEKINTRAQAEDIAEAAKELASQLYRHSQPMRRGSFGAMPGGDIPPIPDESPDDDSDSES